MKKIFGENRLSYLWLLIGISFLFFSNGRWIVSIAPWLSMIFILRFLRTQKPMRGILIGAAVNIAVVLITFKGIVPLNGVLYYVVVGAMGVSSFLPYIMDRILAPRIKTYAAALIFPLMYVALEYVNSQFNPYGSWSSIAYTQYGNLPLMQIVSVTGIWGITFLVPWLAATVNWAWENGFKWAGVQKGAIVFIAVFVSVMAFGCIRLAFFKPVTETVRVASFAVPYDVNANMEKVDPARLYAENPTGFREIMIHVSRELPDILFEKSRQEAEAGAKIVAWSEGALFTGKEDEAGIIERGRKLATEQKIYLMMSMSVIPEDFPKTLSENKVVWISPTGEILGSYLKSNPVPGEACIKGTDPGLIIKTPYGKLSSLICFDMDFPTFTRNMTKPGIDIMINPSADWKEIDPLHTEMIMFRAIENGFSMVRVTSKGLSAAYDYQGRVLGSKDYFSDKDQTLISEIPVKGATTLYSKLGDFIAWLSIAGLLAVIGNVMISWKKSLSVPLKPPLGEK